MLVGRSVHRARKPSTVLPLHYMTPDEFSRLMVHVGLSSLACQRNEMQFCSSVRMLMTMQVIGHLPDMLSRSTSPQPRTRDSSFYTTRCSTQRLCYWRSRGSKEVIHANRRDVDRASEGGFKALFASIGRRDDMYAHRGQQRSVQAGLLEGNVMRLGARV